MVTFTAVGECVLEDAGTVHGTLNTHRPRGLHPRPSVPTGRAPQGASGTRHVRSTRPPGVGPGWTAHGRPRAAHSETWTWLWQKARCARRSPLSSFIGLSSSGGGRCSAHWVRVERFTRMPRKGLPPPLSGSPVSCHQMAKSRDSPSSLAGPLCVRLFQTQQEVWDSLLALTQKGRFSETRWLMRFC